MDNVLCNVVTLDDGVEYTEVSRLNHNGFDFIFLADIENPKKFCIKKVSIEDGKEYIDGLDNKEQFDELFKLFTEKMKN